METKLHDFGLVGADPQFFDRHSLRDLDRVLPDPSAATATLVESSAGAKMVGEVRIEGLMWKFFSDRAAREVRELAADSTVDTILLTISSPGGFARGVPELANAVFEARKTKPVVALIEDLGASAAYWVASQATRVFANTPGAFVGSIGTYVALVDDSKMLEQFGVKIITVTSGGIKGAGVDGKIKDDLVEMVQKLVNVSQKDFNAAIARGRGIALKEVKKLADGRVHPASDAKRLKLIDQVKSRTEVLKMLGSAKLSDPPEEEDEEVSAMAETENATLQEIELYAPQASAKWKKEHLSRGSSVDQVRSDYADYIERELAAARSDVESRDSEIAELKESVESKEAKIKELEEKKTELEEQVKNPLGQTPVSAGGEDGDDDDGDAGDDHKLSARQRWDKLVKAKVDLGMTKSEAVRRTKNEHPKAYRALLESYNTPQQMALLGER